MLPPAMEVILMEVILATVDGGGRRLGGEYEYKEYQERDAQTRAAGRGR
jgi:hypothetical protein